jgi:hypothetical protein
VTNRWIRFLLAVLAIVAAAGAAYRILQDEQRLTSDIVASRRAATAAEAAMVSIDDLKATLFAYVAPGQTLDFWASRSAALLDKLRAALLELDAAASAGGLSLGDSLDVSDRLAAAEHRAQTYVRSEQPLLAGEIIFRESRDLIDGLRINIVRARDQLAAAANERQAEIRREQMYLVGGATGILAIVMLLLVPTGSQPAATPQAVPAGLSIDTRPEPPRPPLKIAATPAARAVPANEKPSPAEKPVRSERPPSGIRKQPDFAAVASLCGDLATVTDSAQMEHVLDRARKLLNARGLIVWTSTAERGELQPVVASGYDARVMARLGPIRKDADNLTAAAFRENGVRSSAAAGSTPAALAVPLPAPEGPAGVFSAELAGASTADEGTLAAARLVAAQLGTLLGSALPKAPDAEADASASTAARSSS